MSLDIKIDFILVLIPKIQKCSKWTRWIMFEHLLLNKCLMVSLLSTDCKLFSGFGPNDNWFHRKILPKIQPTRFRKSYKFLTLVFRSNTIPSYVKKIRPLSVLNGVYVHYITTLNAFNRKWLHGTVNNWQLSVSLPSIE